MNDIINRGLRILLIEDNKDFADIMTSMCKILGHQVSVINGGCQWVEKVKEYSPDIIFCDIGLPDINGYELAKQIRQSSDLGDTYLVALTGYAQQKDMLIALESGFDCHLAKPVDMGALKNILRKSLTVTE